MPSLAPAAMVPSSMPPRSNDPVACQYLFGDSTAFPIDENFLETGCAAVECAVALLRAEEIRAEEKRQVAAIEQRVRVEVGHFDHFEAHARAAYADPIDALRTQIGASAQRMTDGLRAEIMSYRDKAIAQALATAALSRVLPAISKFFEKHQLPDTAWRLAWGARLDGRGAAVSQVHAQAPGGLDVSLDVNIPAAHPWAGAVRVSALASNVRIHMVKKRVLRKPRVELESLDSLYVTELIDLPGECTMTLRRSAKRPSTGVRFVIATDGATQVSRIAEDGSRAAEPEVLRAEDAAIARALFNRVSKQLRTLIPHRSKLRAGFFRDAPLQIGPSESAPDGRLFEQPAAIARLFIDSVAPFIREIAKRSGAREELALKRTLGDGRREELFVSYETVLKGVSDLEPNHRELFDLLGLAPGNVRALLDAPPQMDSGVREVSLMPPEIDPYAQIVSQPPGSMRPLPPPRLPRGRPPMMSEAEVTVQRPFYRPN